jgi:hypothetical protein
MRPHLVLGLALVVACGSFGDGSTPAAPLVDAGAGVPDAAPDSSPVEEDGGVPVADDGGIPVARSCAVLFLCDEFERTIVEDPGWDTIGQANGGILSIGSTYSKSKTRSLRVSLASSFTTDRLAFLAKKLTSPAVRLTARFWLRTEEIPSDADVLFAQMRTDDGYTLFLMFQGGQIVLLAQDANGIELGKAGTALTVGQSLDIAFDYRSVIAPKATAMIGTNQLVIALPSSGGPVTEFEIGATYATEGSGALYHIDDVALDRGL